jgi:hypothetical protein
MVQIERDGTEDFTCTHCGAIYEMSETPAHDSGSAACEVCDMIMIKWVDSAIPLFRAKKSIEGAKRRYFSFGPSSPSRQWADFGGAFFDPVTISVRKRAT